MINDKERTEIDNIYNMFKIKISDCNECPHLNITEVEQKEIYLKAGVKPMHFCNKYKARVIHRCVLSNKEEHYKIFPLDKCDTTILEKYLIKEDT